ncbi:hypothetical protein TERTU_3032 [Teredinibacter turnerae T7901]|uniref:Uncharacterized protein n=1 Tax=Teredinibacter turnerae (strain ATCC 39867 / T7901) TaxID=377629 RepID=C5BP17_TERTT|nr:hypothetical protein TERTU_3032 [Teredinibacter turnerae T7901]
MLPVLCLLASHLLSVNNRLVDYWHVLDASDEKPRVVSGVFFATALVPFKNFTFKYTDV